MATATNTTKVFSIVRQHIQDAHFHISSSPVNSVARHVSGRLIQRALFLYGGKRRKNAATGAR